jgi:hypothetical protein
MTKDNPTTQLTGNEKAELETLESIIQREMGSFIAVGRALQTIRDQRLYREEFKNFKDYCNEKWAIGRHYAGYLIRGSRVATNLSGQDGDPGHHLYTPCEIQPIHERQIRPLAILEPDQQCEVWEEAVRSADGKTVTYKQVKALVEELVGPDPIIQKKKTPHPESDALHFATIARSQLDRIRDDDPLREKALNEVLNWIISKLKEPPVKKSS